MDWDENLGLGTELSGKDPWHSGDGGVIAKFSDGTVTDSSWKAQSFYIAPLNSPDEVVERGHLHDTTRLDRVHPVDSARLVAIYFHYYPLFQQAYRDLGYPQGHFNDRLVDAIDHLLATPEMKTPAELVRPKVFYVYADADLESRSAGQKVLMRMGAANAVRVKAKLRDIRAEIARQPTPPAQGK